MYRSAYFQTLEVRHREDGENCLTLIDNVNELTIQPCNGGDNQKWIFDFKQPIESLVTPTSADPTTAEPAN